MKKKHYRYIKKNSTLEEYINFKLLNNLNEDVIFILCIK